MSDDSTAIEDDLQILLQAIDPEGELDAGALRVELEARGGILGVWRGRGEGLVPEGARGATRLAATLAFVDRLHRACPVREVVDGPEAVVRLLGPRLVLDAQETFWTVALDARGRPSAVRCVARGTLTACLVHPRDVFAPALEVRAHALVLVHNHPSGDPDPSEEDVRLTRRMGEAGQVLGVPVVDHVVIARGGFRSLGARAGSACAGRVSAGGARAYPSLM